MGKSNRKPLVILLLAALMTLITLVMFVLSSIYRSYSSVPLSVSGYSANDIVFDDANDRAIIATDDKRLLAVSLSDQSTAFERELPERVAAMTTANGTVYYTFSGIREIYWTKPDGETSVTDGQEEQPASEPSLPEENSGIEEIAAALQAVEGNTFRTQSNYPIVGLAVSEKHGVLAAISTMGTINKDRIDIFRDLNRPRESVSFQTEGKPNFVAVNDANGKVYYSNGNYRIFECDEAAETSRTVAKINFNIAGFGFSSDGDLICCDMKGRVYFFRYENGAFVENGTLELNQEIYTFCTNPASSYSVAASKKNNAVLIDSARQSVVGQCKIFPETSKVSISREDNIALVQSLNKQAVLFNAADVSVMALWRVLFYIFLPLMILAIAATVLAAVGMTENGRGKLVRLRQGFLIAIKKHKKSYLFLLPTFALLIVFNYFPVFWSFKLAFSDYQPGIYDRFVGFANFAAIAQNDYFLSSVNNMIYFLITDLIKALIPPILFAELILALRSERGKYVIRLLMFIQGILPGIAGVLIWQQGILGTDGLINVFLQSVGLGSLARDWLGNASTAMAGLIFIGFPYIGAYLLFYGALLSVPPSLIEASKIDGCGWWRRMLSIDLPMIAAQIKYVFITSFIGSVQDFGRVYLTTKGGPGNATYIPALEMYMNISIMNNYGAAAAMGLMLFIVIFIATIFLLRLRTHEDMVA